MISALTDYWKSKLYVRRGATSFNEKDYIRPTHYSDSDIC